MHYGMDDSMLANHVHVAPLKKDELMLPLEILHMQSEPPSCAPYARGPIQPALRPGKASEEAALDATAE